MIITKLTGGLGNQMFQYAAGYSLARKRKTSLALDLRSYEASKYRSYDLENLSVHTPKAPFWKIVLYKYLGFATIFKKPDFDFQEEFLTLPKNTYLDGYFQGFQCEKYFDEYPNEIRELFKPKILAEEKFKDLAEQIKNSNSVSIQVRRGDYLKKQETYNILTPEYYKKAQEVMESHVPNPTYFIWSDDDIEWAEQNIKAENMVMVSGRDIDGIDDMRLMSLCKHHILANSSFSWWAAWLNPNPEKVVIAPNKWFNKKELNTKDLIPETWQKI